MASISEQIANICDLGQLNTELIAMNLRRSSQGNKQINQHLQSAEFARRAEILEPRVRADLARGRPVSLREIGDELGVPPDIAFACWLSQFGATIRDVVMD
jgi:hypothetical protein